MSAAVEVEAITREEWQTLVVAGHLDDRSVELLDGRKVAMSPEGRRHVAVVLRLARQLREQLDPDRFDISEGHPVALSDISEPEPDIAVVVGDIVRMLETGDLPGPSDIALVIEVARSSLSKDLGPKADLYRAASIATYLVVDLHADRFVLHRRAQSEWEISDHPINEPLRLEIGETVTLRL